MSHRYCCCTRRRHERQRSQMCTCTPAGPFRARGVAGLPPARKRGVEKNAGHLRRHQGLGFFERASPKLARHHSGSQRVEVARVHRKTSPDAIVMHPSVPENATKRSSVGSILAHWHADLHNAAEVTPGEALRCALASDGNGGMCLWVGASSTRIVRIGQRRGQHPENVLEALLHYMTKIEKNHAWDPACFKDAGEKPRARRSSSGGEP